MFIFLTDLKERMKTKNENLQEQGINLEKDFSIGTYTKIRFAMEQFATDYHESKVKKLNIPCVTKSVCECKTPYFPTGNIRWCSKCDKPTVY